MKLVTAIVRPEKVMDVIKALEENGYFAFSTDGLAKSDRT